MSSPFPGMDPYIEEPEVWSDFHGGLADEMRAQLNSVLQPRYVARLTPRVTYGKFHIPRKIGNSFLGQGTVFRHCPLCRSL
jgi:Protein of unknown function (DUF4058)